MHRLLAAFPIISRHVSITTPQTHKIGEPSLWMIKNDISVIGFQTHKIGGPSLCMIKNVISVIGF
jgi:hypothetical protein